MSDRLNKLHTALRRILQEGIPTAKAPVFGYSGGVLATLGGRQRFVKSGTTIKATVGPRATALYRIEGAGLEGVRGIATLATTELSAIRTAVESL
ncbi:hypothetical protein WI73_21560 [Burkholderia ubonensis]|uniref:hypothetical protein n=1 Tax=Burkholderia ubonensis TaxID=101571 RepID=UPI00075552E6|nr:hypothetical protein [Burkholderia ubonensis]KUZ89159.1 hypothetical protein WI40_28445 [Burkholderia ubonensis]KVC65671.1 hypothetical protein WI73_21560 [Burkholderia ubonensis]